jgi:urocanate hydratase
VRDGRALSVGLCGNVAELLPQLLERNIRPDALTDQTSAHDPVNGYLPIGWTLAQWESQRAADPAAVARAAKHSMARHVEAMLEFQRRGVPTFDYGNNIRQVALDEGVRTRLRSPASYPPISGRSSAAGSDRFAGLRCREILRTSIARTRR